MHLAVFSDRYVDGNDICTYCKFFGHNTCNHLTDLINLKRVLLNDDLIISRCNIRGTSPDNHPTGLYGHLLNF